MSPVPVPRVNVLVKGFKQHPWMPPEAVATALDILPREHLSGLQVVQWDPRREVQQTLSAINGHAIDPSVRAHYVLNLKGIVLYHIANPRDFHQLLYHEIGHFVFYAHLTGELRHYWVGQVAPGEEPVTAYARTNASEAFAEAYQTYVLAPHRLQAHFGTWDFFRLYVFRQRVPDRGRLQLG